MQLEVLPRGGSRLRYLSVATGTLRATDAELTVTADTGGTVAKTVFYSFHYTRDVHRVQLVRNVNALEGQPLLNAQEWEQVKGRGDGAIENWIDDKMKYKRAVVVLVGQETADRPWVRYEISKAWRDCKPLLGVRIHGLSAMGKIDRAGSDPFKAAGITDTVPIFDPTRLDGYGRIDSQLTYNTLRSNLQAWSERGLSRRS